MRFPTLLLLIGIVGMPLQQACAAEDNIMGPMTDTLKARVGTWNVEMRFRPAADAPESVSEATQTNRLVGHWLVSELDGQMGTMPFSGVGLNGYDATRGIYVGTWCDSLSSRITPVEGRYEPSTGLFVTTSQEETKSGPRTVTSTTRTIDANHEETTIDAVDAKGRHFTEFTIKLTRQ